jgi:hypothetical protein
MENMDTILSLVVIAEFVPGRPTKIMTQLPESGLRKSIY